jgi:hypothetical protein
MGFAESLIGNVIFYVTLRTFFVITEENIAFF